MMQLKVQFKWVSLVDVRQMNTSVICFELETLRTNTSIINPYLGDINYQFIVLGNLIE